MQHYVDSPVFVIIKIRLAVHVYSPYWFLFLSCSVQWQVAAAINIQQMLQNTPGITFAIDG